MFYLIKVRYSAEILFLCVTSILAISDHPLLLIISFDGFRYNYFERNLTPEMVKLRPNGTYSAYMTSVFPTKTFPNHFSIATGMYVDVHGVLDNKVFDPILNQELKYGYDLFHYSKEIVPIWTLNERQRGHHSGCMMWPGCDFEYQGTKPKFYQTYNKSVAWENRVDTVISWFINKESPINFAAMYFEEPDYTTHTYGPESPEVNERLKRVNSIVKYLLKKMKETELLLKVNVVMLSDHGGQAVPYTHIINLNKYLSNSTYSMYGVSPNLQIYPKPGKFDEVLSSLRKGAEESGNFSVFTKDAIFEHWHYKDNGRCPPIFLVANTSYVFNDIYIFNTKLRELHNTTDLTNVTFGTHGYDPMVKNMRAFFLAFGPLIRRNHTIPPFVNIDLYPLFAEILGLELPLLEPNGTLRLIKDVLKVRIQRMDSIYNYYVTGAAIGILSLIVVISVIVAYVKRKKNTTHQMSSSYRTLEGDEENTFSAEGSRLLVTSDFEDDSPS